MKISLILAVLLIAGCSVDSIENEFRIYERYKRKKQYKKAVESLDKIISTSKNKSSIRQAYIEKSRLTTNILNQPEEAIQTFEKLSILSDDNKEKNEYRYLVAKIYFEKLNDYDSAIKISKQIYINNKDLNMRIKLKKLLVEAYKNKKNYYQALIEINDILKYKISIDDSYNFNLQKADVLFQKNNIKESTKIYLKLFKTHPSKFQQDKLYLSVLTNYETLGDYEKAIVFLKKFSKKQSKNNEFLDKKLKKLLFMKKNMPGAKGLNR